MAASYPKVLYAGLQAAYDALVEAGTTSNSILYFCTDTGKIYKGTTDFSKYCEAVATRPESPAVARLYLIAATGTAEFYDGSNWHVVSYKKVSSVDASVAPTLQSDADIPSVKAMAQYVADIVGTSADVVKSISAGSSASTSAAAYIHYTAADNTAHDVKIPGVLTGASAGTTAASIDVTDSDSNSATNIVVPGVITDIVANSGSGNAGKIDLTNSTAGSSKSVVVPNVLKGVTAGTSAGKIVVANTTESDSTVTVPGVFVAVTAATGTDSEAKVTFTDSDGQTADVVVPSVITGATWNGTSRVLTFNVSDDEDITLDLGKDIFIDSSANNRYENGNIYLYLNDGTQSTSPTEIIIPVTGLITDYFGDDTESISVNVDNSTHKVTADVVLRNTVAGTSGFTNALKLNTDTSAVGGVGLYVDLSDVEQSIDALAEAITWGSF